MKTRTTTLDATIAYAANDRGDGVAYVRTAEQQPLRVPFGVERYPALLGREVSYAALIAVAAALRASGVRRVRIGLSDTRLVEDLADRKSLPLALSLLYVQLRCALNTFTRADVRVAPVDEELLSRARAEVELARAA